MSELAIREESAVEVAPSQQYQSNVVARLTEWAAEARAAGAIAKSLCDTEFVPKHFRGSAASVTAAILTGFEVGLPPMAALRSIYVISGTPAMYAATMRALVISNGHEIWVEESTDTMVRMAGRRKGSDIIQRVTWTIERAKKAQLTSNAQYQKNPQNMLTARCSAELSRLIAPDVIHGIPYAVEELDDQAEASIEATPAVEAKKRTVKRAPVEQPPMPEPDLDDATPVSAIPVSPAPVGEELITKSQMANMQRLFAKHGTTDRDAKLAYATQVIGREIGSATELTKVEAGRVIDALDVPDEPSFDSAAWPATAPAGGQS